MKPQTLLNSVTSELKEPRATFLLSVASPVWGFAREHVGLWRDWVAVPLRGAHNCPRNEHASGAHGLG